MNTKVIAKFSHTDRTGRIGHNVNVTIYKKVFVKDLDTFVLVLENIDIQSMVENIFSSIRHNVDNIIFLDKTYSLAEVLSTEFHEFYESTTTQEKLKLIIETDVLNNINLNHIPNEVDFEYDLLYDYSVFKIDDIRMMYDLINT